jgi:hypothetical protein
MWGVALRGREPRAPYSVGAAPTWNARTAHATNGTTSATGISNRLLVSDVVTVTRPFYVTSVAPVKQQHFACGCDVDIGTFNSVGGRATVNRSSSAARSLLVILAECALTSRISSNGSRT